MIDQCDPEIVTWSDMEDNFVVKNVEKFSSMVLPQVMYHMWLCKVLPSLIYVFKLTNTIHHLP